MSDAISDASEQTQAEAKAAITAMEVLKAAQDNFVLVSAVTIVCRELAEVNNERWAPWFSFRHDRGTYVEAALDQHWDQEIEGPKLNGARAQARVTWITVQQRQTN